MLHEQVELAFDSPLELLLLIVVSLELFNQEVVVVSEFLARLAYVLLHLVLQFFVLVVFDRCWVFTVGDHKDLVVTQPVKQRKQLKSLVVHFSFLLVSYNNLLFLGFLEAGVDDRNDKVDHNDELDEGHQVPGNPNRPNVQAFRQAVFLRNQGCVLRHCQLSYAGSKSLQVRSVEEGD